MCPASGEPTGAKGPVGKIWLCVFVYKLGLEPNCGGQGEGLEVPTCARTQRRPVMDKA